MNYGMYEYEELFDLFGYTKEEVQAIEGRPQHGWWCNSAVSECPGYHGVKRR